MHLFNRTTRKVKVTSYGGAYYERVVQQLMDMDDAETSSNESVTSRERLQRVFPAH